MNRAGGIIAIIAGIFLLFAAGVTLLVGGVGGATDDPNGNLIIGLGWGGVFFPFWSLLWALPH